MPMPRPSHRLPWPVLAFAWVSLFNEVSAQMVAPLVPLLLATVLAGGPVAIGLVEGLADAVAAFVKLGSGRLSDLQPRRRKAMVIAGYGLALAARPLIGLAAAWPAVAALRAADRLGKGLRGAPRDAMLADATPPDRQGSAYGLNRGMDYAGAVIGTLAAAAALARGGVDARQVVMFSALPGVAVLLLLWAVPTPDAGPSAQAAAPLPPLRAQALPPALRRLLVLLAAFGLGRIAEAFLVLRGHELGLSAVRVLLLWAWLAAVQSLVALLAAPWTDRFPKARLLPWHWASLALGYAVLAFASTGAGLWVAVTLYGVVSGASEGIERAMVSELAGAAGKGTAFGWYHLLTGLTAIAAGLWFGWLWQVAGAAGAFGWAAGVAAVCAAVFAASGGTRAAPGAAWA